MERIHRVTREFIDTPPAEPPLGGRSSSGGWKLIDRPCDRRSKDTCSRPVQTDRVRVVCVSDTHSVKGWTDVVPDGDVLIHAGDLTRGGTAEQVEAAFLEIEKLPHKIKLVVPGNHDLALDDVFMEKHADEMAGLGVTMQVARKLQSLWTSRRATRAGIVYVEHGSTTITVRGRTLQVSLSGFTTEFFDWAFMYPRGKDIWKGVMNPQADILVTHSPPQHFLDHVPGAGAVGCELLAEHVAEIKPKLHVFGHIHEGAAEGVVERTWEDDSQKEKRKTIFCNASLLDEQYRLKYKPSVFDL
ncbi:hypothetical protein PYCC9005_005308 [Savitreella phatthalungensis]